MRKTSKKTNYSYVVNLDDIETLEDIDVVFALAKHNANLPLTDDELLDIIDFVAEHAAPKVFFYDITSCCCPKREPWYKRLWKKIKCAFNR